MILNLKQTDLEKIKEVTVLTQKDYRYHHNRYDLARKVHINESKLCQLFKQVNKTTLNEYQTRIRIEKAKELLSTTDDPIKTIAFKVGFDIRNLDRQFKKRLSISPYAWKKQFYGALENTSSLNKPDLSIV